MTQLIQAAQLTKQFGDVTAVQDVSLSIAEGTIYGLVGPDGAGKTTTIRLLCGALKPTRGQVEIAGFQMERQPEQARAHIGYLAQRFSLYDDLTVLENLRFFAEVRGISRKEWLPRSREVLDFVGLAQFSDRRAGQLSGGMKQKLGLAAAMVHRPKVMLLDEPTTGVDPVTRQDFWQLIIRLVQQEGVAVLISTPYMDEAARCMRLGFMRSSQMLVEGSPSELRAQFTGQIIELRGNKITELRQIVVNLPEIHNAQMFGDRLHIRVSLTTAPKVMDQLDHISKTNPNMELRYACIQPSLEDVFLSYLEEERLFTLEEKHNG